MDEMEKIKSSVGWLQLRNEQLEADLATVTAKVTQLEGLLREVEFDAGACPICYNSIDDGHTPDCRLAEAISEVKPEGVTIKKGCKLCGTEAHDSCVAEVSDIKPSKGED